MNRTIRRSWICLLSGVVALTACQDRDEQLLAPDRLVMENVAMSLGVSSFGASVGDRVSVGVLTDAKTGMLGAVQGRLRFNPAALEYVGQIPRDRTIVVVNEQGAATGELRLIAVEPRGLAEMFAALTFKVKNTNYTAGLTWETENASAIRDLDAVVPTRFLPSLKPLEGLSSDAARRMTEVDWDSFLGVREDAPIGRSALEKAPIMYGDATQNGLLNFSDVTKAARISVGIEECVVGTATGGASPADCVAANVVPENLPGLGEPTDANPPGLESSGGAFSRTVNSSDVLSIARQAVGITQGVAGQQIPVSLLCGTGQNLRTQTCAAAPSDTALVVPFGSGQDTLITGTMTLTGNKVWILNRVIRVGEDGTQGSIAGSPGVVTAGLLVVEAGARVEGKDSAAIVITRAGRIDAQGTPVKPVIFTCVDDDGNGRDPGCWGGVYVAGNAVLNEAAAGAPTTNIDMTSIGRNNGTGGSTKQRNAEGFLPANLYIGGNKDDDNCGTIRYAVFEYGGKSVAPNNELNNLTIGACGSATTLDFIQVHAGTDDGLEIFGGRMAVKHLYATANDDDSFDFSFGYDGNVQFVLVQSCNPASSTSCDKGHEVDNTETAANYNATPRTNARLWNLTAVGGTAQGTRKVLAALNYRRGAATIANNGILLSYNFGLKVDDTESCNLLPITGGTDVGAVGPTDDDLQFNWMLLIDVGTAVQGTCSDAAGQPATAYGTQQLAAGLGAAGGWESRAGMSAAPNRELKSPYDQFLPDFRPESAVTGGTPPAGFDPSGTYLGAFKPIGLGGNIPWNSGWTIGWQTTSKR